MTGRQKLARVFRKWADLIDPRVKPTTDAGEIVVKVSCVGVEEFESQIEKLTTKVKALGVEANRVGVTASGEVPDAWKGAFGE